MNRAITKYWTTYVMIGLVIVFACLYLQQGWKQKGEAPLRLTTLEGDPQAAVNLSVDGMYQYSRESRSRIELNEAGIVHRTGSAFEERLEPWFNDKPIRHLFEGYADFLRGKPSYGTFYVDEDMLVYANSEQKYGQQVLQLSTMNKHTKRQTDFEVNYPDELAGGSWFTDAVQRKEDGQIIVLVSHRFSDNSGEAGRWTSELVRLEVSVEDKAVTSLSTVAASLDHEGRQPGLLKTERVFEPKPYMLIGAWKGDKLEYYIYHTQSGTLRPIQLPDVIEKPSMFQIEGERLDWAYSDGAQIYFQTYDMATGKPASEPLIINAIQWDAPEARAVAANKEAVSIIYENKAADHPVAGVAIVDKRTGEVRYRGEVQADGTAEAQRQAMLKFNLISGLALSE